MAENALTVTTRLSTITTKALEEIEKRLDYSPHEMTNKELRELAFGLLDRRNGGSGPGRGMAPELEGATKGAVLGALEGLASMVGRNIDINGVSERMTRDVTPTPQPEEQHLEPRNDDG